VGNPRSGNSKRRDPRFPRKELLLQKPSLMEVYILKRSSGLNLTPSDPIDMSREERMTSAGNEVTGEPSVVRIIHYQPSL